jgi:hypothetical protein
MGVMDLPGEPGPDGRAVPGCGGPRHPGGWAQYVPLAYVDVLGWVRITAPHAEARAACLSVAAYIHLTHPGLPLRDLDAQAETAIKELEDGAFSVAVIDSLHRVDLSAGA